MNENANLFIQKLFVPLNLLEVVNDYLVKIEDNNLGTYIDECISNDNSITTKLNRGSDYSLKMIKFNRLISDIQKDIISNKNPKNLYKFKGTI